MILNSKIGFLLITLVLITGCRERNSYPDEPVIEFNAFEAIGDKGRISINFTDGDGDMGLRESDTQAPYDTSSYYFNNFFLAYEEKVNGNWQPGSDQNGNPVEFRYRISYLTPEGQNKALKGKIEVTIQPFYYDPTSPDSDTVRFRIKIVDRALHISNEVLSDEIIR